MAQLFLKRHINIKKNRCVIYNKILKTAIHYLQDYAPFYNHQAFAEVQRLLPHVPFLFLPGNVSDRRMVEKAGSRKRYHIDKIIHPWFLVHAGYLFFEAIFLAYSYNSPFVK